jgi:hypothetical protein
MLISLIKLISLQRPTTIIAGRPGLARLAPRAACALPETVNRYKTSRLWNHAPTFRSDSSSILG